MKRILDPKILAEFDVATPYGACVLPTIRSDRLDQRIKETVMLRSSFFSAGLFVALWGVSFLFIDQVVLANSEQAGTEQASTEKREEGFRGLFRPGSDEQQEGAQSNVVDPPDWAAFSLMSLGAVTMLYAAALPKSKGGDGR